MLVQCMSAKRWEPTEGMVVAGRRVFEAMTLVQVIEPVVTAYKTVILGKMKPVSEFTGKIISESESSYEMSDEEASRYYAMVNRAQKRHPDLAVQVNSIRAMWNLPPVDFEGEPDFCPLLVAQDMMRLARRKLVEAMEPITHLEVDRVIRSGLDNYDKLVDLSLRLLAPFVKVASR